MHKQIWGLALLVLVLFCAPAQATHIHFEDYAYSSVDGVVTNKGTFSDVGNTWSHTFKLTQDSMFLWDIVTTPPPPQTTYDFADAYAGSYDPAAALHYVTLRIDPENVQGPENPTHNHVGLTVNGISIANWTNPIQLFDWGVPGDPLSDLYGIADNHYEINVVLTGLSTLPVNKKLSNVNIEGCFDQAAPVPEPTTLLLLGGGLIGLAGWKRRNSRQSS